MNNGGFAFDAAQLRCSGEQLIIED